MQDNTKEIQHKKVAFVLSGGVIKAACWHIGVGMALSELGFVFRSHSKEKDLRIPNRDLEISTYVGSSAGALVSLILASGYSPHDLAKAQLNIDNKKLKKLTYKEIFSRKKYTNTKNINSNLFESFPGIFQKLLKPLNNFSGLFTTQGLHEYMVNNVLKANNFEDYYADLFITATQLDESKKCIFSKFNYPNPSHDTTANYITGASIAEVVSASMSVPPFYSPYPIKNTDGNIQYFIDGEIRETLSTHVALDHGCDYIISSWTHTPYHFHDEIGSLVNYGLPSISIQSIYLMIQKKIISSRARRARAQDIIDTVNSYMIHEKIDNKHRNYIISILENKLELKNKATLIDIYPKHDNYKLFFANAFTLNPTQNAMILKMGYKRTIEVFKNREW